MSSSMIVKQSLVLWTVCWVNYLIITKRHYKNRLKDGIFSCCSLFTVSQIIHLIPFIRNMPQSARANPSCVGPRPVARPAIDCICISLINVFKLDFQRVKQHSCTTTSERNVKHMVQQKNVDECYIWSGLKWDWMGVVSNQFQSGWPG